MVGQANPPLTYGRGTWTVSHRWGGMGQNQGGQPVWDAPLILMCMYTHIYIASNLVAVLFAKIIRFRKLEIELHKDE